MKIILLNLLLAVNILRTIKGQCIPNPGATLGPNSPPFPILPDGFSAKLEANLKDIGKSITAYEYYDNGKQMAALISTSGGKTNTQLFDYKNDQLFYVDEFKHCQVLNLSLSSDTILFGTAQVPNGMPHIFSTNGILHFMKKSGQSYKGTQYVRGINTDHWSTCLVWDTLNATFTLDYFFTTTDWKTPIDFPQIPVRAIATGVQTLPNGTRHQFEHFYEYIDFRIDLDDYTVFETPKGVYCKGRKNTKDVPQSTPAFHFRSEVLSPQSSYISSYDIWYDSELKLVRKDYRPSKNMYPAYTTNPVSEVHDYTTGVRYITDTVSKNCTILPITNSSFDEDSGPFGAHLKNSSRFLFLDAPYAYVGMKIARGIPCDVYTAQHVYPFNGITYNATLDYYFLTGNIVEQPSDGSTTPTQVPFRLEATLKVPGMDDIIITHDFLNYDTSRRSLTDFDISACYKNMNSIRFKISFPGKMMQNDIGPFLLDAQRIVPAIMKISNIRLQNTRVDLDPAFVSLTGTLIDIAPDNAKFYQAVTVQRPSSYSTNGASANRTYDFTGSWQDCATYCVQNFDFVCNSFDFCPDPSNGKCLLYADRRTDVQTYLQNNISPCLNYSIYQRTTLGTTDQETAVADAYGNLQDAIKQNNIYLQAFDQYGFDTDYYAVETEILSGVLEYDEMPSMTGQFSFRQEITFPNNKLVYGSDVWYDYNYNILRYDIIGSGPPFFSGSPLTHIQDFNAGVEYVIDKERNNCTIIPISSNSQFVTNTTGTIALANTLQAFHMNASYKFIGQKTVRGMTCNLFEALIPNFKLDPNDPTQYNANFLYYFLKDGWASNTDTNSQRTSAQPIRLDISSEEKGFFITYNFYNWNNEDPDLSNFNTVPCYTGDQQRHMVIVFNGDYYPYLTNNVNYFKLMVHNKLSEFSNASLIRFQQPQITYGLSTVYYITTVVDQAPQLDGAKVPYYPEPPTDVLFQTLNNNIYRGLFSVTVPMTNGSLYTYQAIAITDNVLRNDGTPLSSKTLSHFKSIKNKSQKTLSGTLAGISVDDCAEACLDELTFDCESFVYCYQTGYCMLAKTYAQSNTSLMYDRPNCDLYYRSYLDKFTAYPGQTPSLTSTKNVIVGSAEACAMKCINSDTCRSFQYCQVSQACSLLQTHHFSVTNDNTDTNSFCTFYSRSYLNDFKYKSKSTLTFSSQVISVQAVSVDQCAQLCIETESMTCNSFAFCGNDTTCRLTSKHPVVGLKTVATDFCSLYTRTYYSSNPAPLQQSKPSSSGYSSGTLAGVAIGVLILGLVIGCAIILILSRSKKLPQLELFNMNYREHKDENQ